MKFGVCLPNFGAHASREILITASKSADELGYDAIWVAERLIVPDPPNQGWSQESTLAYEPLVTLAYLAAETKKIAIGTNILIAPFRNPLVLARQVATLDCLCQGRLLLGLGLGWMAEEFHAASVDMGQRGRRTDEMIDLLRCVWSDSKPSFQGQFTNFPPSYFDPKPVQRSLPIWIGGNSDAALRRVVRRGDGWTPTGVDLARLPERIQFIKAEAQHRKRPMEAITLSYSGSFSVKEVKATFSVLDTCCNLGIGHFCPRFTFESTTELVDQMSRFATQVMPSYRG